MERVNGAVLEGSVYLRFLVLSQNLFEFLDIHGSFDKAWLLESLNFRHKKIDRRMKSSRIKSLSKTKISLHEV